MERESLEGLLETGGAGRAASGNRGIDKVLETMAKSSCRLNELSSYES